MSVIYSIRRNASIECENIYQSLYSSFSQGRIKSVLSFGVHQTQRGAYVIDQMAPTIRKDVLASGPPSYGVDLLHEGGHGAGYGRYTGHQTFMDDMRRRLYG